MVAISGGRGPSPKKRINSIAQSQGRDSVLRMRQDGFPPQQRPAFRDGLASAANARPVVWPPPVLVRPFRLRPWVGRERPGVLAK
jgi:hypothetical protein